MSRSLPSFWKWAGLGSFASLLLILTAAEARGDGDALRAQGPEVKAALFFNIPNFVSWPEEAEGITSPAFTLCTVRAEVTAPFAEALQTIVQDRSLRGRQVIFRAVQDLQDLRGCQMLFTPGLDSFAPSDEVRRAAIAHHILTVGEAPEFLADGGMIRFRIQDGHLAFSVNLDEARAAEILISARLLRLAEKVVRKEEGSG